MKVFGYATDAPEQWTAPFPESNGIKLRLLGGDVYSPDSWNPAKVTRFKRDYYRWPCRLFFSARYGRFGFYIGCGKVYGVDTDNQRDMPGIFPSDVYPGSVAIQGCTVRFSGSVA